MTRIRYGIVLSAVCSAALLTGCGGGGSGTFTNLSGGTPAVESQSRYDAGGGAEAAQPAASAPAKRPEARQQASQGGVISEVELTQQERQVVYTGSMTVRAEEVGTAAQQAKQIVTEAGGHLAKEESKSAGDSESSALLEFKVPPAKYPEVLGRLGKELGRQLSLRQGAEDVTLRVADVESRLKSARESLESLRALLKRADTIGQVLQVEREISAREADLESLQAQQKELATQTAMATLTLRLVGPVTVVEEPEEEPAGFLGGLKAGWGALVAFVKTALTVVGALLPWLVVSLPLIVLLVWLVRRSRPARPSTPTGTGTPPGPPAEAAPEAT
ncbi:DUF4349 domain-containing protein [Nonomuraea candida]|uniref:DUF4349 domain-containing protein n=1 Tax=Nonomuraea candida TaxID=359159 RepID=UPI000694CD88|nr:DUF4349 domain-containing protein [Nonomuraea candida]